MEVNGGQQDEDRLELERAQAQPIQHGPDAADGDVDHARIDTERMQGPNAWRPTRARPSKAINPVVASHGMARAAAANPCGNRKAPHSNNAVGGWASVTVRHGRSSLSSVAEHADRANRSPRGNRTSGARSNRNLAQIMSNGDGRSTSKDTTQTTAPARLAPCLASAGHLVVEPEASVMMIPRRPPAATRPRRTDAWRSGTGRRSTSATGARADSPGERANIAAARTPARRTTPYPHRPTRS